MKRCEVDRENLAPMMKQYMSIKDEYEDTILFFRLGDFYEMFFEDAIIASKELEIVLTGRNSGLEEKVPMCGIPFHSYNGYLEKLVNKGYKVGICEQLSDPSTRGVVERGVVQVVTKGTLLESNSFDEKDNNFIGSIFDYGHCYAISYADISTGDFFSELVLHDKDKLINEILRIGIKELIVNSVIDREIVEILRNNNILITILDDLSEKDNKDIYKDIKDVRIINSIKHLLFYINKTKKGELNHFKNVIINNKNDFLELDLFTKRNLELIETFIKKERTYSLLWLLDKNKLKEDKNMF